METGLTGISRPGSARYCSQPTISFNENLHRIESGCCFYGSEKSHVTSERHLPDCGDCSRHVTGKPSKAPRESFLQIVLSDQSLVKPVFQVDDHVVNRLKEDQISKSNPGRGQFLPNTHPAILAPGQVNDTLYPPGRRTGKRRVAEVIACSDTPRYDGSSYR